MVYRAMLLAMGLGLMAGGAATAAEGGSTSAPVSPLAGPAQAASVDERLPTARRGGSRAGSRHGAGPRHERRGYLESRSREEGDGADQDRLRYQRKPYRHFRRKFGHRQAAGQPLVIVDRYTPGLRRPEGRERIVETKPKEPEKKPIAEADPPIAPLSLASPRNVQLARGRAVAPPGFVIGERLPEGMPHVTLDARTFRLPPPPPGQIYARVRRDVLLIDAATRQVIGIIDPDIQAGSAN